METDIRLHSRTNRNYRTIKIFRTVKFFVKIDLEEGRKTWKLKEPLVKERPLPIYGLLIHHIFSKNATLAKKVHKSFSKAKFFTETYLLS